VIGAGAIIGAGCIVTKNIPPYSIVVGNPSRVIGSRFNDSIISELLELKWWELDTEEVSKLPFNDINEVISILKDIRQ
jgi:carbonic anhydrase/acetyltransferase-like protein (isoleucine patch superfamily)